MENDAPPNDAQPIERRLATILMADVANYSRMMGENEERTVQVLRGHRQVFDELLRLHRGRIFNTAGDAVLAEFSSAVEAVRCATEIQAALHTRNEHLPADQRMLFRIGINLGDVIVQAGDLLGDGVNVAARIQSITEPGGICISGSVYDQIQNKLTLQFKQLGEQSFKNIAQPVRTFSITDDRDGTSRSTALPWRRARKRRIVATIGALIALIASVGVASWFYRDYSQRAADEARRAAEAQRVAEVQRKAEQDKSAAATAQHEAKLRSELQATKDALTQAEASKRKTDQDRAAAAAAQREASLQAELRSVKDAQLRADASEKKADAERKAAAEALRVAVAEAAAAKAAVEAAAKAAAAAPQKAAAPPAVAAMVPSKPAGASAAGLDRFDGIYDGRLCHMFVQPEPKTVCWPAALKVERGALLSTWISRNAGKPAYARGKISPQGNVELTLEGFNPKGDPVAGLMTGTWSDNEINASGAWNGGLRINARWTRPQ
jgi:class 3 adenylate cyclase